MPASITLRGAYIAKESLTEHDRLAVEVPDSICARFAEVASSSRRVLGVQVALSTVVGEGDAEKGGGAHTCQLALLDGLHIGQQLLFLAANDAGALHGRPWMV